MNLYYEIMHKIEFEHFADGYIKAKTKSQRKDLAKEFKLFLIQETGIEWHVDLEIHHDIISVFDQLVQKLKDSEDWKMITKYFPDAVVKDMKIKNAVKNG